MVKDTFRQAPLLALIGVCSALLTAQINSGATAHAVAARLAQWKQVQMPFHSTGLSANERQMVEKLVDASQLLDDVYWRQSDLAGLALYKTTPDQALKR